MWRPRNTIYVLFWGFNVYIFADLVKRGVLTLTFALHVYIYCKISPSILVLLLFID